VIDGDTLWVEVDCCFEVWTKQKLRLRGIDCPELGTPVGLQAKAFVEEALAGSRVVICTSRADKYDRYLADIFYGPATEEAPAILKEGVYLNRQLLRQGLAQRFAG
jgi:endonuclease YncB( thermonuclease family)